jgi:spore germination protein GerM
LRLVRDHWSHRDDHLPIQEVALDALLLAPNAVSALLTAFARGGRSIPYHARM